jgi:hypothetical protein
LAICFVIQPFDNGGKFDKRYTDVFQPAIREAGLEPYRVDHDLATSVLIEDIQNAIFRSAICFADITLDNPNVWFELGYALAREKPICMVCSNERMGKFPFDVQHRSIIRYQVDSASDFTTLKNDITNRLRAVVERTSTLSDINERSPTREPDGLLQHELMVLLSIVLNRNGPGQRVSHGLVKDELERLGYNNIALNIGLEGLISKRMIGMHQEQDQDGDYYSVYAIEEYGMQWILNNHERLNLKSASPKGATPSRPSLQSSKSDNLDDEIPF